MDEYEFWLGLTIVVAVYYTIKNILAFLKELLHG